MRPDGSPAAALIRQSRSKVQRVLGRHERGEAELLGGALRQRRELVVAGVVAEDRVERLDVERHGHRRRVMEADGRELPWPAHDGLQLLGLDHRAPRFEAGGLRHAVDDLSESALDRSDVGLHELHDLDGLGDGLDHRAELLGEARELREL